MKTVTFDIGLYYVKRDKLGRGVGGLAVIENTCACNSGNILYRFLDKNWDHYTETRQINLTLYIISRQPLLTPTKSRFRHCVLIKI